MRFLGVDPGSSTGWAVVESINGKRRIVQHGLYKIPRKSLAIGGRLVREELIKVADEYEVNLVCVEDYADWSASLRARQKFHGRWKKFDGKDPTRRGNWRATYVSVRLVQAISEMEHQYKVIYCYPIEWQHAVCGVAGGKETSRWTCRQIFGMEPKSHHECDAVLIGLYGLDAEIMGRRVAG